MLKPNVGKSERDFLHGRSGALMCDDYVGYKSISASAHVTEQGGMAHARRNVANTSHIASLLPHCWQPCLHLKRGLD